MVTRRMMIGMIVVGLLWMGTTVWGVHYYVDPNGDNSDGLTWAKAFHTIQQGIDANNATIVEVNEANYYESIDFNGVACTVTSTDPNEPNVVAGTIIDANSGTRAVYFHNSEDANSVLEGLTITNGTYGVQCGGVVSPRISKCRIEQNQYGVWLFASSPTVTGNRICENSTYGVYVAWSSGPAIISNWVYDNNEAGIQGALSSAAEIRNNSVVKHAKYGIRVVGAGTPEITNCIVWDCNDDLSVCSATYSCIEDGDSGTGNISSYPYFEDFNGNDFHLTWNSPCINRGDPNGSYTGEKDIDGEDRVIDGRVDIGGDEFNLAHINLVKNPGFEDGTGQDLGGHWIHGEQTPPGKTPGTYSVVDDSDPNYDGIDGNYLRMVCNDSYWHSVRQADGSLIKLIPGEWYKFSVLFKTTQAKEALALVYAPSWLGPNGDPKYKELCRVRKYGTNQWAETHTYFGVPYEDDYGRSTENDEYRVYVYGHFPLDANGDPESSDAVLYDNISVTNPGPEFTWSYGAVNEPNLAETVEFGATEKNIDWVPGDINSVMSDPCTDPNDENITYRKLLAGKTLTIKFPAFNLHPTYDPNDANDMNSLPLGPMLLEIMYKDTVGNEYTRYSHRSHDLVIVRSKIDYINLDPDYLLESNDRYCYVAQMGGQKDNKWKHIQYAFQKSDFQLLRALNNEFTIGILNQTTNNLPSYDIPIDYVTLRKISNQEYETLTERQRDFRGFYEVEMPPDNPASPSYDDPNLVVFSRDIMRPVYKHTKPDPNEPNDVNGFGCWGETESVAFSIYSESGINDLTVSVSNLTHSEDSNHVIGANDISIYEVVYDESRLCYKSSPKSFALLPDRIEESASLSADPNGSKRVWLKIQVPDEAEGFLAGIYEGEATITRPNEPNVTVDIDFTVYDVTPDMAEHLNPVYHAPYKAVYASDLDVVLESYTETGVDAFISTWTHSISVSGTAENIVLDSNNFKQALGRMVDAGFVKNKAVHNLYDWDELSDIYEIVFDSSYSSKDPNLWSKFSDPNFASAYGSLIEEYITIAQANDVNLVFTVTDEPGTNAYKRILADRLFTIMKDPCYVDPNYSVETYVTYYSTCDEDCPPGDYNVPTPDGNIPPLTDLVDYKVWAPSYQYDGYTKSQDPNYYGVYGYYTTGHSHWRDPVYNRFLHGLFAFGTDATCVAGYAMGDYVTDPYNDFDPGYSHIFPFTYPDFIYAYPTWTGELVHTMGGLEGIREGIKDAKYIATLKRLIDEDPQDPNNSDANDFLQDVKDRIEKNFKTDYYSKATEYGYYDEILADINDSNDPNDFEAFTRIRKTIADHIVACSTNYYGVHNTTQDKWYYSINTAIDEANSADVIELSKGTYYENIDYDGKAITIKSKDPNDSTVVAVTIISGNGSGNVVAFDSSETSSSVLEGLTIADGNRGIYCYYSSPTISKCVISGNVGGSSDDGGGLYNDHADPNVLNCTFTDNEADDGGGMANYYGDPFVLGCTFTGNEAYDDGGGMWNYYASPEVNECVFSNNIADSSGGGMYCSKNSASPRVIGCVFAGNTGYYGGGMSNWDAVQVTVANCLFYKNIGDDGGGMFNEDHDYEEAQIVCCTFFDNYAADDGGAVYHEDSSPRYSSCILWDDTAGRSGDEVDNDGSSDPEWEDCDIEGCGGSDDWDPDCGDDDGGNIDDDPNFVNPNDPNGADDTWANCDDGLRIESDSPCVDEGEDEYLPDDVDADIKGSDREIGSDVDMGAYEYDSGC